MRVPLVTVALYLAPALVFSQSLGDAARRQAEKRAGRASAAAKAYTDADLQARVGDADTPGDPDASPLDSGPAPGGAPGGAPAVTPLVPAPPLASDDPLRAQLDREAEQRKQLELRWRQRAGRALARLEAAQRGYEIVCGPGVLVLTGG
jgi:hypothetical protein